MLPLTSTYYDAEKREWSGPERKDRFPENMTLGEAIYEALHKNPKKVIQIYDVTGEQLTCEDLLNYSERLSRQLMRWGLKVGDVISLYATNTTHVVTVMLASFLCGTPADALYPSFDKETVTTIYKAIPPKIIFCDVENYAVSRDVNEKLNLNVPIIVMNGVIEGVPNIRDLLKAEMPNNGGNFRFPCLDLNIDDTAAILCTSGTTGPPKGAKNTSRGLLNHCVFLTMKSTSVAFSFSPMYWASGLWTLAAALVNASLRIVTDKPFTPEYFIDLVKRYQITHVVASPVQMAEVTLLKDVDKVQESLTSIDTMIVAGAKVPRVVQEKMHQVLSNNTQRPGLAVAYGMSELAGMLSFNGGYPCERLVGSEGKLVANRKARIIDKEGKLLGPNEQGEICIYWPFWTGYQNNEEATRKALIDNWLHTGDIGYFDDEGFLHVCTRDNDVFKSNNFQIYPQIIEDIVIQLRGVLEVCVFGIPNLLKTNLTACAVVRTPDEDGLNVKAETIIQHVKDNIGVMYQLEGGVYFLDALPKTGSGKVQRPKVLEVVMKAKEGK